MVNFKKYKIKEKAWSFKADYKVFDENNMEAFHITGQKFSFRHKLSMKDWQGQELFTIVRKLWSWKHTFHIMRNDDVLVRVIKKRIFKQRISIEYLSSEHEYEVKGNFWGNEYKFLRDEKEIAVVSRDIWKLAGSYGVAIHEEEDVNIIIATVIIIDVIRQINSSS